MFIIVDQDNVDLDLHSMKEEKVLEILSQY